MAFRKATVLNRCCMLCWYNWIVTHQINTNTYKGFGSIFYFQIIKDMMQFKANIQAISAYEIKKMF